MFYNCLLITWTILTSYFPVSIQSNLTFAQENGSQSEGCRSWVLRWKNNQSKSKILNQPGNGPENQNEEFRNDYIKGFNDCYGGYNTCYNSGVLDGMTVNENMRTGQFESQLKVMVVATTRDFILDVQ